MNIQKAYGIQELSPITKYDALQDKFASFYFNGYGVKKHLKKLKKAVQLQPHQKGYKKYTEMLAQKLTELEGAEASIKHKIKPYQQSLKPSSQNKLKKIQNNIEESIKNKNSNQSSNTQLKKHVYSFQNLPQISKDSKLKPIKEKDKKSSSLAERFAKANDFQRIDVNRDRSNKSINMKKLFKKRKVEAAQHPLKELQHEEFVLFLKKRQDDLLDRKGDNQIEGKLPVKS